VTTVHIASEGPLRRLTRNRPEKLKAFTRAVHAEPRAALAAATADAACLRTGAGGAVSAGKERSIAVGPNPALQAENRQKGPLIGPIATREKSVSNGIAAGANIARQGIGPASEAP
jgi:enoyl-CoA hydratase/carnithine racemase